MHDPARGHGSEHSRRFRTTGSPVEAEGATGNIEERHGHSPGLGQGSVPAQSNAQQQHILRRDLVFGCDQ